MPVTPPVALTIAGFDPSSGAGITADLMVFAAHRVFGISAITALTVQSTLGVRQSHAVSGGLLEETLNCLGEDLQPDGIKIGMLASAENVLVVANFLERLRRDRPELPVILDPVLRSTSGRELLSPDGVQQMRTGLLPFVTCVTPNRDELHALGATDDGDDAVARLIEINPDLLVLVTGGDQDPPDDFLYRHGKRWRLPGSHIETSATHGTGCALSSAMLCGLMKGLAPEVAAALAKAYVRQAMLAAPKIGHGKGPMNHLWTLRTKEGS